MPQKASIKELAESLFPLVDARVDETLPTSEAYRQAAPQLTMSKFATTLSCLFLFHEPFLGLWTGASAAVGEWRCKGPTHWLLV